MHCAGCVNVNVAKRAFDQCSIFSTIQKFRPDYGLLLELHALTLVAPSCLWYYLESRLLSDLLHCIYLVWFNAHH